MGTLIAAADILTEKALIEENLRALLPAGPSAVCRAMRYAVLGAGQRLRPALALRVARMFGAGETVAVQKASAVELLHCASLIVDDLPCMDNDSMRRSRASLHVEFGEATAVLAAFGLVGLAARSVADYRCFQLQLLRSLDCDSLIGGQALDLQLTGEYRERSRAQVTALKTVPLFQLAVEAGLPDLPPSPRDHQAALAFGREFGVAYQTTDDFLDGEIESGSEVLAQFARARACLEPFGERAHALRELLEYLNEKIRENSSGHR